MAVDYFSLEDALQLAASNMAEEYDLFMRLASFSEPSICRALSPYFRIRRSFTAGSMIRQTWGDTRREVDLYLVLDDAHREHLTAPPAALIEQFADILRGTHYTNRRTGACPATVGMAGSQYRDLFRQPRMIAWPAFEAPRGLIVPDQWNDRWICIDPTGFDALAKAAGRKNPAWRDLVRILKTWNNRDEKFDPFIKPGLLIEAMVMEIAPGLSGLPLGQQLCVLFETMHETFDEERPDPAGLAPSLTSYMSPNRRAFAKQHIRHAWLTLANAKRADNGHNYREAKRLARSVLGRIISLAPRDEDGELIKVKVGEKIY